MAAAAEARGRAWMRRWEFVGFIVAVAAAGDSDSFEAQTEF